MTELCQGVPLRVKSALVCVVMRQDEWGREVAAVVARQVRVQREKRRPKMSAQELSDRCSDLGYAIPRSVLTNLENGRRETVTVAELLVLAAALGVPPLLLVFPVGAEDDVEALPDVSADAWDAFRWATGTHLQDKLTGRPPSTDGFSLAVLNAYREYQNVVGPFGAFKKLGHEDRANEYLPLVVKARADIRRLGCRLPELAPELLPDVAAAEIVNEVQS